jgi:minor extracellular serine protease Vpr
MTVRIGVVDTGVDLEHPAFKRRRPRGIGVRLQNDGSYKYTPDFNDSHGHGTAMTARIRSFCPRARLYAVRIAQQNGDSSVVRVQEKALAMGIEWCVDQGIRIVNVSYSIEGAAIDGYLARAWRKAHEKNAIIVASYRNGEDRPVYPAAFSTVIGVRSKEDLRPGEVAIISEENHDLSAAGGSTSIACAQVSSMVGRIHLIDGSLGLEDVFAFLREVAVA